MVYVLNKQGKPIMPCKEAKARKLLKQNKAKIAKHEPYGEKINNGSISYKRLKRIKHNSTQLIERRLPIPPQP